MTTYTRTLTAEQINLLRAVVKFCDQGDDIKDECRKALDARPVVPNFREHIAATWAHRCEAEGLRKGTKGREAQALAYLQGVLAVATVAGLMTMQDAERVAFLCMAGRVEEWLAGSY